MKTAWLALLLTTLMLGACDRAADSLPPGDPPRAVVISPAITSIIFEMGLGNHVVGVTDVEWLPEGQTRPVVGNALNIRAEPILAVKPDVILVQIDPAPFDPIRRINPGIAIEHFRIETLADIPAAMRRIGSLLDAPQRGEDAAAAFETQLEELRLRVADKARPRVFYVMGYQQPLSAGAGTFIDDMITAAGGENILGRDYRGWVQPTLETIIALQPDVVICQVQPTAARKAEARDYWTRALARRDGPPVRVYVNDDRRWTIPTGGLIASIEAMQAMVHPADD